ncbi:MAG: VWA domain-containing protein [Pirellulales bacterium]|nr:VWA domain-containing protein [Pirellulales bacterium]
MASARGGGLRPTGKRTGRFAANMFDYSLHFDRPIYLWLLAVVPLFWVLGRHSLAALGGARRWLALALRTAVATGLILALAGVELVRTNDRVTVMYLVDRSLSVPGERTEALIEYVNRSVREHRNVDREDRAGVIVFGADAAFEVPPLAADTNLPKNFETLVDTEATNLSDAIELARAAFPPDTSKRIVIVSDGNENIGDAWDQAQRLADSGIGIDVIPLARNATNEVAVEKVVLPTVVREGSPFDVRVVLQRSRAGEADLPVTGRLRVLRSVGDRDELLVEQPVTLQDEKHVFTFRDEAPSPDFYTYKARFVADDPQDDSLYQNNEATGFARVEGRGQVLLVEDWERPGEFAHLVERLRAADVEVTVQTSDQLFTNLAQLQRYDTVILANVARASAGNAQEVTEFSEQQIDMLVRNTQQMGAGLIMLGGPQSFGAGGWANTKLEEAMPVDFHVQNAKVVPTGALMLVLDTSGSMSGEKIELSKAAAIAAMKVLGERDLLGVVAFDSEAKTIVPMKRIDNYDHTARQISRMGAGGGTDMMPGLEMGYAAIRKAEAGVKHVIVLTDGQTNGSGFERIAADMKRAGITTTAVAVGADSASSLLNRIATAGGGKFYQVNNPSAIPKIFMREAMTVARPLVYEDANGFAARQVYPHEMLGGIEGPLPPLTGFVMTTVKEHPLVESVLRSDKPPAHTNTVLAAWQYGLGRSVAFTTDAGQRWTKQWANWSGYDKLFSQMVRWSMRPSDEEGNLSVYADVRDRQVELVVTALDEQAEYLNFLDLSGTIIGPDLASSDIRLTQTAPGRYVGKFPATKPGSYFFSIHPAGGGAAVRGGVSVPYSPEFADRESNAALLERLASIVPEGGKSGQVIPEPTDDESLEQAVGVNVFRRDLPLASSRQSAWHVLAFIVACLFFADVFNRRVMVDPSWIYGKLALVRDRVLRRERLQPAPVAMARLQARKEAIHRQMEERRAAAHFEPQEGTPAATTNVDLASEIKSTLIAPRETPKPKPTSLAPEKDQEPESYTERLLKAKRQVWKDERK